MDILSELFIGFHFGILPSPRNGQRQPGEMAELYPSGLGFCRSLNKQIAPYMLFRPSSNAVLETPLDAQILTGALCPWSRNSPGAAVPLAASATPMA